MKLRVRDIGKFKTVVQVVSVVAVLMAHAWPNVAGGRQMLPGERIAIGAIWVMLAVSLLSALVYFRAFLAAALAQSRERRSPLPFVLPRPGDKRA